MSLFARSTLLLSMLLPISAHAEEHVSCVSIAVQHVAANAPEAWAPSVVDLPVGWTPIAVSSTDAASHVVACVEHEEPADQYVYVTGGVKQDGPVAFRTGLTATQALTLAGGPTEFSKLARASVVRGDEVIRLKLRRMIDGAESDLALEPDDRLIVRGW